MTIYAQAFCPVFSEHDSNTHWSVRYDTILTRKLVLPLFLVTCIVITLCFRTLKNNNKNRVRKLRYEKYSQNTGVRNTCYDLYSFISVHKSIKT